MDFDLVPDLIAEVARIQATLVPQDPDVVAAVKMAAETAKMLEPVRRLTSACRAFSDSMRHGMEVLEQARMIRARREVFLARYAYVWP